MPKGPCTFRKSDVKRAIEAAESAGMKVARVEVDAAGKISLIPGNVAEAAGAEEGNPWDTIA
jgi:Tfp pilus assembly PilM family ATPase